MIEIPLMKFVIVGKYSKKVIMPNPIGQIINCFDKIIPSTNGSDFLKPNLDPATNKIILAGPGLATIEILNTTKLQKY